MTEEELEAIIDRNMYHKGDDPPRPCEDIALLVAEIRRLQNEAFFTSLDEHPLDTLADLLDEDTDESGR